MRVSSGRLQRLCVLSFYTDYSPRISSIMADTNYTTKTGAATPVLAGTCFAELPVGCGQLVDTSGPPGSLKRATALVALAAGAMVAFYMPVLAAATLLIALMADFVVLLRFRRRDPRGPMDQQATPDPPKPGSRPSAPTSASSTSR